MVSEEDTLDLGWQVHLTSLGIPTIMEAQPTVMDLLLMRASPWEAPGVHLFTLDHGALEEDADAGWEDLLLM